MAVMKQPRVRVSEVVAMVVLAVAQMVAVAQEQSVLPPGRLVLELSMDQMVVLVQVVLMHLVQVVEVA
jgi:hypothetical protein